MYEEQSYEERREVVNTEASICGMILNYPERAMAKLPDYLRAEDFTSDACSKVFYAALSLKKQRKSVDEIAIRSLLRKEGMAVSEEAYEGMKALGPSPEPIQDRAKTVYEASLNSQMRQLCQELLDSGHGDVSEKLHKAASKFTALYSKTASEAMTIPASRFRYEPPKWLIEPYFQRGKGTLVQADPGVGKTAFMCAVAAAVTTGQSFLGLTVQTPGNVVMLSVEDDPGVLRGRLEANGADVNRVFFVNEAHKLALNSPEIEKIIAEHQAKMIVFDPFQAFLGAKVDLFRANETRPILSALFEMCARHDCACVIIAHLGKNTTGKSAVNQSLGSVDIPGAMRSILHIVRDSRIEGQLLAVQIKSSNAARGKSIAYSIGHKGSVNWLELTDDTLESIAAAHREQEREKTPYEYHPLLPVLLHMRDNNHINCFWSYEEIRQLCVELLHQAPFTDGRTLTGLLSKDFLEELERREGIQIHMGDRYRSQRGLRLMSMPKEGEGAQTQTLHLDEKDYQEMMAYLDTIEPQAFM